MFSLVGKKVGMTQVFSQTGDLVAVTVIEVSPNLVISLKQKDKDGYDSVVIGYGQIKKERLNKPTLGQYKKVNGEVRRHIYELKGLDVTKYKEGDLINLTDIFNVGDLVDIQGKTRGHGYTGAIKLWNFRCGPMGHGAGYPHRFGGSLETGRGGSAPQKVWKGKKMGGRYGNEIVTAVNLEIIYIDQDKNLLFIKGCVPGRSEGILKIKTTSRKRKQVADKFKIHTLNKEETEEVTK